MLLPAARQDRLVRATDIDALSCRFWANKRGYFAVPDRFISPLVDSYNANLRYCDGYTAMSAERTLRAAFNTPKFPLINRGTYLRTYAIDTVVELFVEEHNGRCQIVALGGGLDTRAFRVLEKHSEVVYVEVDFPESVKIKKIAIQKLDDLRRIVGLTVESADAEAGNSDTVGSKEQLLAMSLDLCTDKYKLLGFDLRSTSSAGAQTFDFLDKELPTLVISECVLCYLGHNDYLAVLKFWREYLRQVAVVVFEPMALGDGFGQSMTSNLNNRGINLEMFHEYLTLASRKALMESELGYRAFLTDMAAVGGFSNGELLWTSTDETRRIARVEMMDEVEEITLMLRHYSLVYAESSMALCLTSKLPWVM